MWPSLCLADMSSPLWTRRDRHPLLNPQLECYPNRGMVPGAWPWVGQSVLGWKLNEMFRAHSRSEEGWDKTPITVRSPERHVTSRTRKCPEPPCSRWRSKAEDTRWFRNASSGRRALGREGFPTAAGILLSEGICLLCPQLHISVRHLSHL